MVTMPGWDKNPGGLGFAEQALAQALTLRVVGQIFQADAFDRDGAADGGILRTVDNPHGAPPQLADDVVPANLFHGPFVHNFSAQDASTPN